MKLLHAEEDRRLVTKKSSEQKLNFFTLWSQCLSADFGKDQICSNIPWNECPQSSNSCCLHGAILHISMKMVFMFVGVEYILIQHSDVLRHLRARIQGLDPLQSIMILPAVEFSVAKSIECHTTGEREREREREREFTY